MSRRRLREAVGELAALAYAVAVLAVVVAPAVVLQETGARGGVARSVQGLDLVVVSAVVGTTYAVVAWRRLRRESTATRSRTDVVLAAVQALVVLSLAASLLLAVVLHGLGPLQAYVAGQELSLLALWGAVQLVAVVLAELTERAVFRWLTGAQAGGSTPATATPSGRGGWRR